MKSPHTPAVHDVPEPLYISKLLVNKPWVIILATVFTCVLSMAVVMGGQLVELHPGGEYDFSVGGSQDTLLLDGLNDARSQSNEDKTTGIRTEESQERVIFIYKSKTGNVLTEENMKTMCEIENVVRGTKDYDKYSLLLENGQPSPEASKSILKYYYGNFGSTPRDTCSSPITSLTQAIADALVANDKFYFDNEFNSTSKSLLLRSMVKFGQFDDDSPEEFEEREPFWMDVEDRLLSHFDHPVQESALRSGYHTTISKGDLEVRFLPGSMNFEVQRMIVQDLTWIILCIVWVYILMVVHTRSFWNSSWGMVNIFLSFPIGLFVYRVIWQVSFFSFMNILAVFIVLGVGADDVFVFVDAWRQTASFPGIHHDPVLRMDHAWRRAAKAMFVTSSTTMVAFLATATSAIVPMSALGLWAAAVILVNYLLVITFFPAMLIIWSRRWENHGFGRCFCCAGEALADIDNPDLKELSRVESFFRDKVAPILNRNEVKYPVVLVFVLILALSLWQAFLLEPPTEDEKWFPDTHAMQSLVDDMEDKFGASNEDWLVPLTVMWGIDGAKKSQLKRWDPNHRPDVEWDDDFPASFASNAATHLTFMEGVCDQFANEPCDERGCEGGKLVSEVTSCFPKAYKAWNNGSYPSDANLISTMTTFLNSSAGSTYKSDVGVLDGQIKFAALNFELTLRRNKPHRTTKPVYDFVDDLVSDLRNKPGSPSDAQHTSDTFAWIEMRSQEATLQNAVQGIALCFPLSFLVLTFATGNVVVGAYGIIAIAGIVATVMGMCKYAMDWSLGTAESIAVVILIGFSVDYTVHLGHMYLDAPFPDRAQRVTHALGHMAVTVLAGAGTTFGAGVFLWGCQILFFNKFAFILTATVSASVLWSIGFLMAILAIAGPENEFASLHPFYRWVGARIPWLNKDKDKGAPAAKDGGPSGTEMVAQKMENGSSGLSAPHVSERNAVPMAPSYNEGALPVFTQPMPAQAPQFATGAAPLPNPAYPMVSGPQPLGGAQSMQPIQPLPPVPQQPALSQC